MLKCVTKSVLQRISDRKKKLNQRGQITMANEILKDEILSEEELDGVAGGTIAQTVKDTQFLHALGLIDKAYTAAECKQDLGYVSEVINTAVWNLTGTNHSAYGVGVNENSANTYSYNDFGMDISENFTREEFLSTVCRLAGKPNFDYKPYL